MPEIRKPVFAKSLKTKSQHVDHHMDDSII